nr:uncharacterized protein LOC109167502 [Ipomoea trifida]
MGSAKHVSSFPSDKTNVTDSISDVSTLGQAGIENAANGLVISEQKRKRAENAKACSITAAMSDHLPIHLQILPSNTFRPKSRFRFENLWLRESICRDIMIESWVNHRGQSLIDRIGTCGKAIWNWGRAFATNFSRRIAYWRNRMERMQYRRDLQGISFYKEAQFQYLRALHHQNDYWRQRAKQFWLKEGDTNSSFFHNAVKRRRQTNNIAGLKDENGTWIERGTGLDTLVTSHFSSLFKSSGVFQIVFWIVLSQNYRMLIILS